MNENMIVNTDNTGNNMGINVKNLVKTYGRTVALGGVSLDFNEKKIYGLLGRNGAGKTTLLNIIAARLFANSGEVTMNGETVAENKNAIGKIYMMNEATYYPDGMRVRDAFIWSGRLYGDGKFDAEYARGISRRFDLNVNKKIKSLSTGQTSIFKLIVALSLNVPYILFDEPVLGLDANNRDLFYRLLIEKYSANPFCAVISTHLIEEVCNVVDDVVIINKGKIIRNESRESLLSQGYAVSGASGAVDAFTVGREKIGEDTLGGLKTAYMLGAKPDGGYDNLEFSKMDLQKFFVVLTNSDSGYDAGYGAHPETGANKTQGGGGDV